MEQTITGNTNVQIGGDNKGDIVIQQPPQQTAPTTYIHRTSIKPIRIGDTPFKNGWLLATGAIGVTANLINIINFFRNPTIAGDTSISHLLVPMMLVGILLLLTAGLLYRSRYITLPFGHTIEADKQGRLYFTKIGGTCGLCKEPVRIRTVGPKENRQTRIECSNNPDQHWWEFDRTILLDVDEEYRQQKQ